MKQTFKIMFFISLLMLQWNSMQAQGVFFAKDDNAFFQVNSLAMEINILVNDFYSDDTDLDELKITITSAPSHGYAAVLPNKRIEYEPNWNYKGPDVFEYQISTTKNGGKTARAKVYINVNDKPDVISDAECYIDPIGIQFAMEKIAESDQQVNVTATPLCGDIDGDGNIEIVTFNTIDETSFACSKILVYRYDKAQKKITLPYTINIGHHARPLSNIAIAKVDGNSFASIFFVDEGGVIGGTMTPKYQLARYDLVGGSYLQKWRVTFGRNNELYMSPAVLIADLMGSGRTQICLWDQVFDTKTGALLADGYMVPTSGLSNFSFGMYGHTQQASVSKEGSLVAGDIDGDGILELIGGDCVYKVNLTDFDKRVASNTFSLYRRANRGSRIDIHDGGTALVDMDLDGKLDVVVTANSITGQDAYGVYVYNPRTGAIMHNNTISDIPKESRQGPSRPFVGDIDGDGYPEICMTAYCTLRAYELDGGTTLRKKWELPTTDISASTTLSMFDFTQDGVTRLIYRDQSDLRIINGSGSTAKIDAIFNGVCSGTVNEYPIVADIDGDGHAEIITTGDRNLNQGNPIFTNLGWLQIYAAKGAKKWAPARPVWNQYAYNPVYVNDDLTIPRHPISPATTFSGYDAAGNPIKNRPFNNFLQQATSLNREGSMIMVGPDLAFNYTVSRKARFDASGNMHIMVGIQNTGDAPFTGQIQFQLWIYTKATNTYTKVGAPYIHGTATSILSNTAPSNKIELNMGDFVIPAAQIPADWDDLQVTINLDSSPETTPVFHGMQECEGWNNRASGLSLVEGSKVVCVDASKTESLTLDPGSSFWLKWYSASTGGAPVVEGDTHTFNCDLTGPVRHYFVEVYRNKTWPTPITTRRDTIFIYAAADTLIWTGKQADRDWNNPYNWKKPTLSDKYPMANVPRPCTNVLIPDGIANYPNLLDVTKGGYSDYTTYSNSACNNISFEHGGEVQYSDLLSYGKAYVDLRLQSHRWYLFAPPLQNFYTGDIYCNDPIPFLDDVKAYAKLWARRNPDGYGYLIGWTKLFSTPNATFVPGQGTGVWISDPTIDGEVDPYLKTKPFMFHFPKADPLYYKYRENTTTISSGPYLTPRTSSHRFIFDGQLKANNDIDLKVDNEDPKAGDMVLIGNPFMAQLDFDKFYNANSASIRNYYSIFNEYMQQKSYVIGSPSDLKKKIAPMQAFLVELRANGVKTLRVNSSMTIDKAADGGKLKNAQAGNNTTQLIINAYQEGYSGDAYLFFDDNYNSNLDDSDIASVFSSNQNTPDIKPLTIYTREDGKQKLAYNYTNAIKLRDGSIPLGIYTPRGGEVTINVACLNTLPEGITAYIVDSQLNVEHDLMQNSMYTTNIDPKDLFVDDRFSLRFMDSQTGVGNDTQNRNERVRMYIKDGNIRIDGDSSLGSIQVYNLQGQLILTRKTEDSSFEAHIGNQPVYVVKVANEQLNLTKKLVNIK